MRKPYEQIVDGKLMKLDPVRRSELYVLHTSTLVGD